MTVMLVLAIAAGAAGHTTPQKPVKPNPPKGFTALFNGKDLTGWRGRQPNYDPAAEAKLTKEELATKQAAWNTERDAHWTVDTDKGEIVSDGKNPHLATVEGLRRLRVPRRLADGQPNGDSGIYLRGIPQVQIWDPSNPREVRNGAEKGSGALWNNKADNPGKFPLVKADNPDRPVEQPEDPHDRRQGVDLAERQGHGRRPGAGQLLLDRDAERHRSPRAARSSCRRTTRRCASATSTSARFPQAKNDRRFARRCCCSRAVPRDGRRPALERDRPGADQARLRVGVDGKGAPVTDLTAADFTVKEGGKDGRS